jgi:hypothetical protein
VSLASRDALKRYLGIDASDSTHDDLIDELIAYASERIESYCRRRFASEEVTEYHDGPGTNEIVLLRRPVSGTPQVYVDSDREFPESSRLPASEVVVYPETGVLVRIGADIPGGRRNVKVAYAAGYGTVPDDLEAACVKLAASWYAHARSGADGVRKETLGDYAAEYSDREPPADVASLLSPYREPSAG